MKNILKGGLGEPYLPVSKDEQERKLNARINEIIKFFETKTIDEAAQQRRIENASKAMKMLSENMYFPSNQRNILRNDIFMLESNIEKQSNIEEASKTISEELGNALANGKGIRKISRAIMKYNNMEIDDTDNR